MLGLVTPITGRWARLSPGAGGRGHCKSRHGLELGSRVATPAEQLQEAQPTPGTCPARLPPPAPPPDQGGQRAQGGGGVGRADMLPPFRGWDPGAWAEAPPLPGPRFPPLRLGIVTLGADTSHSAQAASEPGLPSGEQGRTQRPQAARRLQQQILPFGSWALQPKAGPLGRAGQGADSQALLGSRTGPRIRVGRASGPSHPSHRAAAGPLRGEPL